MSTDNHIVWFLIAPFNAQLGDGVYFTDITPNTMSYQDLLIMQSAPQIHRNTIYMRV